MTTERRTALVVLKPGFRPGVAAERAGEVPPDPHTVSRVLGWFRRHGFETGPFVGISFAITGDEELFAEHLGSARFIEESGGEMAFPLDSLDEDIRPVVEAVVVPAPPAFGPGNP